MASSGQTGDQAAVETESFPRRIGADESQAGSVITQSHDNSFSDACDIMTINDEYIANLLERLNDNLKEKLSHLAKNNNDSSPKKMQECTNALLLWRKSLGKCLG